MIFKWPLSASLSILILSTIAGYSHVVMAKDEAMILCRYQSHRLS